MPRKTIETGLLLVAVPSVADEARHVTRDRQTALCGKPIPGEWYASDAGPFGAEDDCGKCYAELKKDG